MVCGTATGAEHGIEDSGSSAGQELDVEPLDAGALEVAELEFVTELGALDLEAELEFVAELVAEVGLDLVAEVVDGRQLVAKVALELVAEVALELVAEVVDGGQLVAEAALDLAAEVVDGVLEVDARGTAPCRFVDSDTARSWDWSRFTK